MLRLWLSYEKSTVSVGFDLLAIDDLEDTATEVLQCCKFSHFNI